MAGSNVLFAAVTELSDSVLKGAEANGLNGVVRNLFNLFLYIPHVFHGFCMLPAITLMDVQETFQQFRKSSTELIQTFWFMVFFRLVVSTMEF